MTLDFENMDKQNTFSIDLSIITMDQEHREALQAERAKVQEALVANEDLDTPYLTFADLD